MNTNTTDSQTHQQQQQEVLDYNCNKKTKQSITFDSNVVLHKYLHINDYSDEEIQRTWFNINDLDKIRADVRETVHLMIRSDEKLMEQTTNSDDWYCVRGLESLAGTGAQQKRKHRTNSYNAVFDEQDLQWDEGIYDAELIADVYYATTQESKKLAYDIGLRDERDVRAILSKKSTPMSFRSSAMVRPPRLRQISGAAA